MKDASGVEVTVGVTAGEGAPLESEFCPVVSCTEA